MTGSTATPKFIGNPETAEEFSSRANWKCKREDFRGAVEDYSRAIELNPQSPELYVNRALARRGVNDRRGEIEDCTKALDLDPEGEFFDIVRFLILRCRAEALYASGDYRGTVEDLTACIDRRAFVFSGTFLIRGNARWKLGDREGACRDWRTALEELDQEKDVFKSSCHIDYDEAVIEKHRRQITSLIEEHCPDPHPERRD